LQRGYGARKINTLALIHALRFSRQAPKARLRIDWKTSKVAHNWIPDGWKSHEARHLPDYQDTGALAEAEATLAGYPPLVFAGEARALKAEIANWRWAGVPFYLRTGKRLATRVSEIVIEFKPIPHNIFGDSAGNVSPNQLVIRLQPGGLAALFRRLREADQDVALDLFGEKARRLFDGGAFGEERRILRADEVVGGDRARVAGEARAGLRSQATLVGKDIGTVIRRAPAVWTAIVGRGAVAASYSPRLSLRVGQPGLKRGRRSR